MSNEYALERTHGQETVMIHAADLYLLENWKDDPTISDEAQRSAIFGKWLNIGSCGRMPYSDQLEDMWGTDEDITKGEKDLLSRVRNPLDRQGVSYTRLVRTFYGDQSDIVFPELITQSEYDGAIFDNATLYDAGSDDGLQSLRGILTRIPQILEATAVSAFKYEIQRRETLEKATGKDNHNIEFHFEMAHQAARWCHLLIYDKEAYDSPGHVLVMYLDDRGRVLRYSRLLDGTEDLQAIDGMLLSGQDIMHGWWEDGRYGEEWEPQQLAKRRAEVEHV
ncbi:uncharacterized protein N7503_004892 [Penicillium pulvis]|uniref:uncharacterized protein n=1 Tax=Penicillium pulvis TaxID=1562058 RepID=UPI0025496F95|nr:uncharacterized protein N7503_004892 [Penicillium pulvis]KAJ5802442.1 hypothetical protein N7503_004892 [Penicillium pulvis]